MAGTSPAMTVESVNLNGPVLASIKPKAIRYPLVPAKAGTQGAE